MRKEVKEGWKVVERRVKEMGFSPNLSSVALREVNSYLVRESPFAHLFRALGVTRGQELNRSFAFNPRAKFFEVVQRWYYLFLWRWVDEKIAPELPIPCPLSLWELDRDGWGELMKETTRLFSDARKRAYFFFCLSAGEGKLYFSVRRNCSRVLRGVMREDDETLLTSLADLEPWRSPSFGLTLFLRGLHECAEAQRFFRDYRDIIREEMLRNAFWRYNLGLYFPDLPPAYTEVLTGLSLNELNFEAEVYQRKLCSIFHAVKRWELATVDVQFSAEQLLARDRVRKHRKMISMNENIKIGGAASGSVIPDEVQALADRLAQVHGQVLFTIEAGGRHLYIPDPELLVTDGEKELYSRHMAINADKYLGLGKWDVMTNPTEENKRIYAKYRKWGKEVPCCMSMKTGRKTTVAALLACAPIEQRVNFLRPVEKKVITGDGMEDKHLVYDEEENLVPEAPGEVIPLSELAEDHPAILYLRRRGFDPARLEKIYGLSYCIRALPEDRSVGRYYSRIAPGVLNTPQGRIIIPIKDAVGVQRGWQARLIDLTDTSGDRWIWCGDAWRRVTQDGECVLGEGAEKKIRKYLNARGMQRNSCAFGLPQAIEHEKEKTLSRRVVYLMEGALDVAKGEPPCVALLGKSMSDYQADVILNHFGRAVLVCDNDRAGKDFLRCVRKKLECMEVSIALLPQGRKDLGECSYEEAAKCLRKCAENAS